MLEEYYLEFSKDMVYPISQRDEYDPHAEIGYNVD